MCSYVRKNVGGGGEGGGVTKAVYMRETYYLPYVLGGSSQVLIHH